MALPKRKRIRLPSAAYSESGRAFSITIATTSRRPVFEDHEFGLECIEILADLRRSFSLRIFAFCLMPDHAHLLLSTSGSIQLPQLIGRWKSLCYQARRRRGQKEPFWQRSFFDHGLRDGEDPRGAGRYILENPVRAGLVADFHDYALCGSFEFDL
jgi:putative transposase